MSETRRGAPSPGGGEGGEDGRGRRRGRGKRNGSGQRVRVPSLAGPEAAAAGVPVCMCVQAHV